MELRSNNGFDVQSSNGLAGICGVSWREKLDKKGRGVKSPDGMAENRGEGWREKLDKKGRSVKSADGMAENRDESWREILRKKGRDDKSADGQDGICGISWREILRNKSRGIKSAGGQGESLNESQDEGWRYKLGLSDRGDAAFGDLIFNDISRIDRYSFVHILTYIPKNMDTICQEKLSKRQKQIQNLVLNFKNHGYLDEGLMEAFVRRIENQIGNDYDNWVVCFVPASNHVRHRRRYGKLAEYLKSKLKCDVFLECVWFSHSKEPSHLCLGGSKDIDKEELSVNSSAFSEKNVILIDDIVTAGRSFCHTAKALENAGAGRIHGVMLAKSFCPRYLRRNPRKMRQPLGEL